MRQRSILVRSIEGGEWTSPETSDYRDEAHLQSLLASDPSRIPGVGAGSITAKELPTSAGPIDVAVVDLEGRVTVVECKLSSNSERRRMVVGQVLDYAAAIWSDGPDELLVGWRRRTGVDLAGQLGDEALVQFRQNISEGRVNLCLAVDRIDADIRRLVEYLNRITTDFLMVVALELSYARHGDLEILIPDTFGGELAAVKERGIAGTERPRWTLDVFVESLKTEKDRVRAQDLFARAEALTDRRGPYPTFWFGNRPGGGIYFNPYGFKYAPFNLRVSKDGQLMVIGDWGAWRSRDPEGHAEFARFLGFSHLGPRRAVPLGDYDLDEFWQAALRCAEAINYPE